MQRKKRRAELDYDWAGFMSKFVEDPVLWLEECLRRASFRALLERPEARRELVRRAEAEAKACSVSVTDRPQFKVLRDFLLQDHPWSVDCYGCVMAMKGFFESMQLTDDPKEQGFCQFDGYPQLAMLLAKHYDFFPDASFILTAWRERQCSVSPHVFALWQAYPLQCSPRNPAFQLDTVFRDCCTGFLNPAHDDDILERCVLGTPYLIFNERIYTQSSSIWNYPSTIVMPRYPFAWEDKFAGQLLQFQWQRLCARAAIRTQTRFAQYSLDLLYTFLSLFPLIPLVLGAGCLTRPATDFCPSLAHLSYTD